MPHEPTAFLSYARADDHDGRLSKFRERIATEVCLRLSTSCLIFMDVEIAPATPWGQKILETLGNADVFIAMISPSLLKSDNCRDEYHRFLIRERSLEKTNLVVPVYWRSCPPPPFPWIGAKGEAMFNELRTRQMVGAGDLWEHKVNSRAFVAAVNQVAEVLVRLFTDLYNQRDRTQQLPLFNEFKSYFELFDKPSTRTQMELAFFAKQTGSLDLAKQQLIQLAMGDRRWREELDLMLSFIYLFISVYDKTEDWATLDSVDKDIFIPLMAEVRLRPIRAEFEMVSLVHCSSMGVAYIRQLRTERAFTVVNATVGEIGTDIQAPGLTLALANALTVRALARLAHLVRKVDTNTDELDGAWNDLRQAEDIYQCHGHMGTTMELHHLGRFYGTRAFVGAERKRRAELSNISWNSVLDDARKAHDGNRTIYGRVAGQYCDAYCRYQHAQVIHDKTERENELRASGSLLQTALGASKPYGPYTRFKIAELGMRVMAACGESQSDFVDCRDEAALQMAGRMDAIEAFGLDAWLGIPLN